MLLLKRVYNVLDYLDNFNIPAAKITYPKRVEKYLIDKTALREAVINAIVHNDYVRGGSPLFEIYDEVKTILESIDKGRLSKIDSLDYRFVFFALVEITKQWDSNSDLSLFELILVKLFNQQNKLKGKVLNEIYKCMDFLDRHLAATFLKQFIM